MSQTASAHGLRAFTVVLAAAGLLTEGPSAFTQPQIPSFTVGGGGGASQAGTLIVVGTVGQPDAGFHSGGAIQVYGGFWGGVRDSEAGAPTPTPTGSLPVATPTRTPTPGFDLWPVGGDGLVNAKDLLELLKSQERTSGRFFDFAHHWDENANSR